MEHMPHGSTEWEKAPHEPERIFAAEYKGKIYSAESEEDLLGQLPAEAQYGPAEEVTYGTLAEDGSFVEDTDESAPTLH